MIYIFNVNNYLTRKRLYHMKDNDLIYHLTESLFKIIDFLVTSILLKLYNKIWLALDRAHYTRKKVKIQYTLILYFYKLI